MALIVRVCLCPTLLTVPCSFQRGNPGWEECLAQSPMTMECPASLPLTGLAYPSCPRTPSCKLLGFHLRLAVGGQVLCPALHAVCSHAGCGLGLGFCWPGALGWGKAVAQARADGGGIFLHTVSSSVVSPLSQALPYLPQIMCSSPGHHVLWRPMRTEHRLGGEREKRLVLSPGSLCCFKRLLCCFSMFI